MDGNLARWMRLKRYNANQINFLHRKEAEAEKRWDDCKGDPKKRGDHWTLVGSRIMDGFDVQLGAFWESRKTEPDRDKEVEMFGRRIYTIWRPVLQDPKHKSERAALHAADLAVYDSSVTLNYGHGIGSQENSGLAQIYGDHEQETRKDLI